MGWSAQPRAAHLAASPCAAPGRACRSAQPSLPRPCLPGACPAAGSTRTVLQAWGCAAAVWGCVRSMGDQRRQWGSMLARTPCRNTAERLQEGCRPGRRRAAGWEGGWVHAGVHQQNAGRTMMRGGPGPGTPAGTYWKPAGRCTDSGRRSTDAASPANSCARRRTGVGGGREWGRLDAIMRWEVRGGDGAPPACALTTRASAPVLLLLLLAAPRHASSPCLPTPTPVRPSPRAPGWAG